LKKKFFADPTSIVAKTAKIGRETKIWHFCHVMDGVKIGERCSLGQNVYVGTDAVIGNNVKIQNNVSIYSGVTLEDDVFCGPSVTFTNIKNPRSRIARNNRQFYLKTLVKKGASIGANATIICGNCIGTYSFVGAGSVVTRDIPDYSLVYGNPARIRGWICACGTKFRSRLKKNKGFLKCPECGKQFKKLTGNKLTLPGKKNDEDER